MIIDLHIHTRTGSDGDFTVEEVFREAKRRRIDFMSITDHDSIAAQAKAVALAQEYGIGYITGIELNFTFEYPGRRPVSLDLLGYGFDAGDRELRARLKEMRERREERARRILDKLNAELQKEHIPPFTPEDMAKIQASAEGALGRPHIAAYLVKKDIVQTHQEAFDRYLVKCDVPKYPLALPEASRLIRNAGGVLVLAHGNDPGGTSLASLTTDLKAQVKIIEDFMLQYLNGLECWHPRHDARTVQGYTELCRQRGLLMTGGTDCHQKPVLMGSLEVPDFVARQFKGWQQGGKDERQAV